MTTPSATGRAPRVVVRPFRDAEEDAVVALWAACGLTRPWNDPHRDIARKKLVQRELFLVAVDQHQDDGGADASPAVVGTAMAGYDGHRGWVWAHGAGSDATPKAAERPCDGDYLAADPARRGSGIGTTLMAEVESRLLALGCAKVNVQIRSGNEGVAAFYDRLGYAADGATGLGKRLIPDA